MESLQAAATRAGTFGDHVRALRPRQWVKNVAVLAALVFARRVLDPAASLAAFSTVLAFCGLGSATYLVNDVADRDRDRLHPTKKDRPIAAGLVPVPRALVLAALLAAGGLGLAFHVNVGTGLVGLSYLLLQAAYTKVLKHVVLLDVGSIAAGFMLRVAAGAQAVQEPISHWLYLCTLLLSLFLALGKRRHELVLLDDAAAGHRGALARYSVAMVDQMISVITAGLILAYALYTVSRETIEKFHTDRLSWTVPLVLYGVFRYLYLIHREGKGGAPEKVLTGDVPMIVTCLLYAAMVGAILYT